MNENESATTQNLGQYYLQVQALTPVETQKNTSTSPTVASTLLSDSFMPLVIFLGFIGVTLFGLLSLRVVKGVGRSHSLGMMIAIIAILAGGVNIQQRILVSSNASNQTAPQNLVIEEVTAHGFVISWETDIPTSAFIQVTQRAKPDLPAITFISKADHSQKHWIQTEALESGTAYLVEVSSNNSWYNDNGQPIVVTTVN